MSSSEKLNILVAYPYMDKRTTELLTANQDRLRFLLDSGAFTAWKAGKEIKVDDYCRFIDSLPIKPWRYFTLDAIGDPHKTLKNYETMLERGYNPVPIFTRGESLEIIDHYYKTSDVVGVGGLVGTKGNRGFVNGVMQRVGDRKVHWLGFTSMDYIKRYRPYMCDSSSWIGALRYAQMKLYDKNGIFVSCSKKDFQKMPNQNVLRLLREYEVDIKSLSLSSNWKNSGCGKYPVEKVAFRSYVKLQNDVERNIRTKMFMAIASDCQVKLTVEAHIFWRGKK